MRIYFSLVGSDAKTRMSVSVQEEDGKIKIMGNSVRVGGWVGGGCCCLAQPSRDFLQSEEALLAFVMRGLEGSIIERAAEL